MFDAFVDGRSIVIFAPLQPWSNVTIILFIKSTQATVFRVVDLVVVVRFTAESSIADRVCVHAQETAAAGSERCI